jgi:hypothetical protein
VYSEDVMDQEDNVSLEEIIAQEDQDARYEETED